MKAELTKVSDRELRIVRMFQASRARVWEAMTTPALLAQWWGRGHKVTVEKFEFVRGGHWRFVEQTDQGPQGFEGRYSEIVAPERVVQTFEWDGMPGHVCLETMTLESVGPEKTKLVTTSLFMTTQDFDGMMSSGMEGGMNESYAALDRLLAK